MPGKKSKKSTKAHPTPAKPTGPDPKRRQSFIGSSPLPKVLREVSQRAEIRQPLIRKLEDQFQATIVTLFTSFVEPGVYISDDEAELLEGFLSVEHQGGKIILIVNSPGGQALAAERIVNVCRAYSNGQFEVIVPHMAKSAATMICFGAAKIHMSKTAELGPVDPQVVYKDDAGISRWISAEEYVRSYNKLMEAASDGKAKRIEPFIQQLNRFDARYVESLLSAQALSKDISLRLLKTGMMRGHAASEIEKKIEVFLSQARHSAHGRMINHDEAKECGLVIDLIDLQSAKWNILWELFVRSDWAVSNSCNKLIESSKSAISQ